MDIGVQINQYMVIEHIGRGGMADVWSARDKRLNRTVAIKTIARDLSATPDVEPVRLFEREAQTIAGLEHPHILPIYDFGEFEGQLYIVMRYVTGGSLEDILSVGPLTVAEALRMARSIGHALDHAHTNHVVHLDIKPSNILLDSNRSPYLADFGLATMIGPEGRAANPGYGTLLYMAPEQLTEEAIDHRADIYAFTILVFHMLTGEMPFDATTSLALKQLQFQEDLPNLDSIAPGLPPALTPILRRGTALDVESRPNTLMALVEELERVLLGESAPNPKGIPAGNYFVDVEIDGDSSQMAAGATIDVSDLLEMGDSGDMALREAHDLYQRARRAWAFGQGRFLMGITHFMLVNDYYMKADEYTLSLDESGMQMLLRGALEYDHEIDYWWQKLDDENRRWVTLHAIRSDSAPARTRALYRLETLPDSDPAKIPTLVAQALQVERNEAAMRAAIHVLTTRAQIMARKDYEITGEMSGSMLTTRARLGIQTRAPAVWREKIYSPDIDLLLAEIALDSPFPSVSEQAARSIGRIRSLTAVQAIAEQQRQGKPHALRALALVRDEAPSLPPIVSSRARLYAWLDNTIRRLTDQPMGAVWRYVFALVGGFLAIGGYAWFVQDPFAVLLAQRSGLAISSGLVFGALVGFVTLLGGEFPARLRGFWNWSSRLIVGLVLGVGWGILTWAAFTWFFLNYPPEWNPLILGGVGLAIGYVLTSAFRLPGWLGALITAVATYLPIYFSYVNYMPPIVYFREAGDVYPQGIFVAVMIALGGHAQAIWYDIRRLISYVRKPSKPQTRE